MTQAAENLTDTNAFIAAGIDSHDLDTSHYFDRNEPEEKGPKCSATIIPLDRLPLPKSGRPFGLPPRASLYHTQRAEAARQRAEAEVPGWLAEARQHLMSAGVRRGNVQIADTADHNAMTLAYALRYAECGLHVADAYAIDPRSGAGMSVSGEAKVPLGAGWQDRASDDPEQIKAFWSGDGRYPENKAGNSWRYKRASFPRNVSIVLPYGCGLFVLDEDGDEGMAAVADLEAQHGTLPQTPDSRSGSGKERPNYVAVVFISNNSWVVPTDGEDARRFLVLHCHDTRKQDAAFFGAIDDQMENGGLEAMVHELTHWNPETVGLSWASLRNPPVTDGLRQQAGMGLRGPAARLVNILESGVLSGREGDGSVFYYALSDDQPTRIARHHLVLALNPDTDRGNMTGEIKAAIDSFLGTEADGSDNKVVINYQGAISPATDERPPLKTGRVRFVTIPALSSLAPTLARYGRG